MRELREFLAEQYSAELKAFRGALDLIPAEQFNETRNGHSPAWQALHVAEWLRLAVLGDRSPTYGHLGWEDQVWAQTLSENPTLREDAGKDAVLAHLEDIAGQVLAFLRDLSEEDLRGTSFSPSAPGGERPRLQGLGLHVRHIAYHRGQVRLGRWGEA